jgi:hypothetical protein
VSCSRYFLRHWVYIGEMVRATAVLLKL